MIINYKISTLCLVLLDSKEKKIYTTYIGDSVYMLFRYKENKFSLVFKAKEQQHKFNMPYQVIIKVTNINLFLRLEVAVTNLKMQ